MAEIDIVLRGDNIWMPVDFRVPSGSTLTWNVWTERGPKSVGKDQVLERTPVPDAKWIVSFRDGTTFGVRPKGSKGQGVESPDVRSGQEIDFSRTPLKGRYSYRFAIQVGDTMHGVFDCPSIIIT